jgi:hypothetical protein
MALLSSSFIAEKRLENEKAIQQKASALAKAAGFDGDAEIISGIAAILFFMRDERISADIVKQQKHLKHFFVSDDALISYAQNSRLAAEYALLKNAIPFDDDPCHKRDAQSMGLLTGPMRLTSKNQTAFNHAAAKRQKLGYLPKSTPTLPFDENGRLYLSLEGVDENQTEKAIAQSLTHHGYTITDYQKGLATDQNGKQTYRIGKILNKIGAADLYDAFHADPMRQSDKLMVVISQNADDVLRQSMNRGWISCTSPARAEFIKTLDDVEHGAMIAYLVSKDDPDIKNPLARSALRPYFKTFDRFELKIKELEYRQSRIRLAFSKAAYRLLRGQSIEKAENNAIFVPEKTYGLAHHLFRQTLENFTKDILNQGAAGLYRLHPDVYPDSFDMVDVTAHAYNRHWVKRGYVA